jgi:hypothetical protein
VRDAMKTCAAAWRAMAGARRSKWHAAARALGPEFRRQTGYLTGYSLFLHCARNCLLAGAPFPERPPHRLRPAPPRRVELIPETDPRRFRFAVTHDVAEGDCQLYRLLVQITPATARGSRAPETRDRRMICGYDVASAPPLAPSGRAVEFQQARFAVAAGRRFGAWVRLIRLPDGLDSGEVDLDLVR